MTKEDAIKEILDWIAFVKNKGGTKSVKGDKMILACYLAIEALKYEIENMNKDEIDEKK
jgi:hypothetical protein